MKFDKYSPDYKPPTLTLILSITLPLTILTLLTFYPNCLIFFTTLFKNMPFANRNQHTANDVEF